MHISLTFEEQSLKLHGAFFIILLAKRYKMLINTHWFTACPPQCWIIATIWQVNLTPRIIRYCPGTAIITGVGVLPRMGVLPHPTMVNFVTSQYLKMNACLLTQQYPTSTSSTAPQSQKAVSVHL